VRAALRRWACVLAVGGAVLAETCGARAGSVAIATNFPPSALSPISDSAFLMKSCADARQISDDRIDASLADSDASHRGENRLAEFGGGAIPVASFLKAADEKLASGGAVSFPSAVVEPHPRAAGMDLFVIDDGTGTSRIPPAALIPLPAGMWTTMSGLGGLALISAAKRVWKMR
jgi:hypothetical protein